MKIAINRHLYIKLLIVVALMLPLSTFADSMAIFTANPDFSAISSGKAKMIFKGKVKRLNNQKYSLVDWPAGSTTKIAFYLALLGQSESRINATRAKLIFSGQGFPPKVIEKNNLATLERFLMNNPNSISYAPISDISDDFNILFIIQAEKTDEK